MIKSHLLYQLSYRGEGETLSKNRSPGNADWFVRIGGKAIVAFRILRSASPVIPPFRGQTLPAFRQNHRDYFLGDSSTNHKAITVKPR